MALFDWPSKWERTRWQALKAGREEGRKGLLKEVREREGRGA